WRERCGPCPRKRHSRKARAGGSSGGGRTSRASRSSRTSGLRIDPLTYSIVTRDKETGQFGVAVQSHYFQVSPAVPWALAGVGAVATQSQVNLSYGPLGLDLLQAGYTAEQAVTALTAGDPLADV